MNIKIFIFFSLFSVSASALELEQVKIDVTPRAIALYKLSDHFHVVVTNISSQPIRLWREWNSWGYFNLSFVITDDLGKKTTLTKQTWGRNKNAPTWRVVVPGEHVVYDVRFDPSVWLNSFISNEGGAKKVLLQAVFEVKPDQQSRQYQIWTGRIVSQEKAYQFYW